MFVRLIVVGASSFIGGEFMKYLSATKPDFVKKLWVYAERISIERYHEIQRDLQMQCPGATHLISFIGRTHGVAPDPDNIDYLENKPELNVSDNLIAPYILSKVCKSLKLHFTYLGSGCIFTSDIIQPPLPVDSSPSFFGSAYSRVKGVIDQLMDAQEDVLNVRIRMPITTEPHDRDFITKITRYAKVLSMENSVTVLPDCFPFLLGWMKARKHGTHNLTNHGSIEHEEILKLYKEIIDPSFEIKLMTPAWGPGKEYEELLAKRSNCILESSCGSDMLSVGDSIRRVLSNRSVFCGDVILVYHICAKGRWKSIVNTMYNRLKSSGLYTRIHKMKVTMIGTPKNVTELEWGNDPKIEWFVTSDNSEGEGTTIRKLKNDIDSGNIAAGSIVLYMHSKGVSYTKDDVLAPRVDAWTELMLKIVVDNYRECWEALLIHGAVGANLELLPSRHFSGNFWWAKYSHLRQLPQYVKTANFGKDDITIDFNGILENENVVGNLIIPSSNVSESLRKKWVRERDVAPEMWIGRCNDKNRMCSLFNSGVNHYETLYTEQT